MLIFIVDLSAMKILVVVVVVVLHIVDFMSNYEQFMGNPYLLSVLPGVVRFDTMSFPEGEQQPLGLASRPV